MFFHKNVVLRLSIFFTVFALLFTVLTGCGVSSAPLTEQAFLLDTIVSVTFYREKDRAAVQESLELCETYSLVFSRTDSSSELYRLNESDRMEVSEALLQVLNTALEYCRITEGRFDITLGGVSSLYDFSGTAPHCPAPEVLAEALQHVGYSHIHIDGSTVTLDDPDTVIDLGAVAKGYIADEMKALLRERGVSHAIISLGGNVLTLGGKSDGSSYTIGIQYPEKDSTRLISAVSVTEDSVVTSGMYERFFIEDGTLYHHILDPKTGGSLHSGLLSVSIIGPRSLDCDALSTACFALGLADGMALIEATDGYEAVFVTEDQALHTSSGFEAIQAKNAA